MSHLEKVRKALAAIVAPALLMVATGAQALPYFNGPMGFGFDNDTLQLPADYVLAATAPGYVESGVTDPDDTDLGLTALDISIGDTTTSIDRTVTWTFTNNQPATLTDLIIVFTGLGANAADYPTAHIDIDIDGFDPMIIANLQIGSELFWLAGYRLTSADFDANQMATRTFRYTVDVGQVGGKPPELGIMYMTDFTVPEPATGLLFGSALLMACGAGRRRRP